MFIISTYLCLIYVFHMYFFKKRSCSVGSSDGLFIFTQLYIITEAEPYGKSIAVVQHTHTHLHMFPYTATSLMKPTTFSFNSSPLRSLGAGPCHSGIERTLLKKVIGREPDLWRFLWASAICQRTVGLCH